MGFGEWSWGCAYGLGTGFGWLKALCTDDREGWWAGHHPEQSATLVIDAVRGRMKEESRASSLDIRSLLLSPDPARRSVRQCYQHLEKLCPGGFATVFCARDVRTGDECVIKAIPKQDGSASLYTELEAMIELDHPNVVKLYEYFEDASQICLVTELCAGGDFGELGSDSNREEVRLLFRDLVMAVAYCHGKGVAHRDLKFENCLVQRLPGQRPAAKVIDFGLSAIRRPGDVVGRWANDVVGTRYFLAPEVLDPSRRYGVKCDCWSVGVMLYVVLTDEHPCAQSASRLDAGQLFRQVLAGRVRTCPLEAAEVCGPVRDLILRLLVKDPDRRLDARSALDHEWFLAPPESASLAATRPSATPPTFDPALLARMRSFGRRSRLERAVLTLAARRASAGEVQASRAAFLALNGSNTGSLTKDEIRAGMNACGLCLDEEALDEIFQSLDTDGTGTVHYTQWLAATMEPSTPASEKAVKRAYSLFAGEVSREELRRMLSHPPPGGDPGAADAGAGAAPVARRAAEMAPPPGALLQPR